MPTRPWLPTDLPAGTLLAWYRTKDATGSTADGSDLTLASGAVSSWADRSGNGRDAGQASGSRPAYTGGEVVFTGGQSLVTSANLPITGAASRGLFVAARRTTTNTSAFAAFFGFEDGARCFSIDLHNPDIAQVVAFTWGGGNRDLQLGPSSDAVRVVSFVYDGTQIGGTLDGGALLTSTVGLDTSATPLTLGRRPGGNGEVADREVVLTGATSPADRQRMEGYLAANNGSTLVDGHPYRNAPPTVVFRRRQASIVAS